MTPLAVHRGEWTPDDRSEEFYRYLPFDVPPGVAGVRVRLEYNRAGAVLDLGCVSPERFRGWSGGARGEYVVGARRATPGYLPGELEPGEWHVVLGLHRVPRPVRYAVEIEVSRREFPLPRPASAPTPRPRTLPTPPCEPGMRWLRGDLHSHSEHSDGALSLAELGFAAAEAGLDFLAVTDHNTVSHHPHLAELSTPYTVLIPGQEVTTERGHANAFGDVGWIDFRRPAAHWVSEVDSRGGLLSINHPIATDCAWRQPLDRRPPLAEIWHCTWTDRTWSGPLAWWQAWGADTVAAGGSDFHAPGRDRPLGTPTTWVCVPADAEITVESVLDGLRAGRTAVSASPAGPVLARVDDELVAWGADGAVLSDFTGRRRPVRGETARFPAPDGPCWLEDADTAVLALCNAGK
ncbi:MAG: CehA/McbA family metallohydrolase [Stackebrandtia sp.]